MQHSWTTMDEDDDIYSGYNDYNATLDIQVCRN